MIICMLLCAAAKFTLSTESSTENSVHILFVHRCPSISISWKVEVVKLDRICESYVRHCDDTEQCVVVYVSVTADLRISALSRQAILHDSQKQMAFLIKSGMQWHTTPNAYGVAGLGAQVK